MSYFRSRVAPLFADIGPPDKRRRYTTLNARYDRMIDTVSVLSPSTASSRRGGDSGSSDVTGLGVPKTPVESYQHLQEGGLGKEFSIIKLNTLEPSIFSANTSFLQAQQVRHANLGVCQVDIGVFISRRISYPTGCLKHSPRSRRITRFAYFYLQNKVQD